MRIKDLCINEIFDSRGEPTLEVGIINEANQSFLSQVPCGKSKSPKEPRVLSCNLAQEILNHLLKKELVGKEFKTITQLDSFLLKLDSTPKKEKLGGNLMLGISIAFSKALAHESNQELWQVLKREFFKEDQEDNLPYIFSNLINGGLHAKNNLDFQEYMVIVKPTKDINQNIKILKSFYKDLGLFFKKERKLSEIPLGDEGGYSLNFKNNSQPLETLTWLIKRKGLENEFSLALDIAASSLKQKDYYLIEGKPLDSLSLEKLFLEYFKNFPLLYSIEDPFSEDEPKSFGRLLSQTKNKLIVGDDLTCTNPKFIKQAGEQKLINGVIIKPNQIGTVSETVLAIKTAKTLGLKVIISHRSGETQDNFIIHLAKASNAFGVKIGAPFGIRLLKFEELARIYS